MPLQGQHETEQMVEKKITEKSLQALSSHTFTPLCKRGQVHSYTHNELSVRHHRGP